MGTVLEVPMCQGTNVPMSMRDKDVAVATSQVEARDVGNWPLANEDTCHCGHKGAKMLLNKGNYQGKGAQKLK